MSSALTPTVINPLSTSNAFLISLPSIFPAKPSSLSSYYSFLSLKAKTQSSKPVLVVARTSDWAQQEEDDTAVVEEEEEEEAEFDWGEGAIGNAVGETEESGGEEGFIGGQEKYQEPNEDAKLFVGNLPREDFDSEKLAQLFDQAGVVEVAEVIYRRRTSVQSRGFGFVTMSTVEEAEKAAEMFNRYDLNGRFLAVNKASPKGSRSERPSLKAYVGNLPWDMGNERLEQLFREHGKVVNASVIHDRGRSCGFGFVTMSTEVEFNDAVANLDGQEIGGRQIRVKAAEERLRRTFCPGMR